MVHPVSKIALYPYVFIFMVHPVYNHQPREQAESASRVKTGTYEWNFDGTNGSGRVQ